MTAVLMAVGLSSVQAQTNPSKTHVRQQSETSHLIFVTEYVGELAAIENIRESAEKEQNQEKDDAPMSKISDSVHASTMFQLELQSQTKMLRGMRLNPPFDFLIPAITDFYQQKIQIWQKMADTGSTFLSGPKLGVDYGKLRGELPKLRAKLEFIDKALFEASPGVFATLIDTKQDSQHHASHLIITKDERSQLLDRINTDFGSKLDKNEQNWTVSTASVLKKYLLKDFKSSDEPWE
jgi:hypothetical protein